MATAVLDLDVDQLPPLISDLQGYSRALILMRLRGKPVGQALLPVVGGQLAGAELRDALLEAADSAFWEHWLRNYLGLEDRRPSNSSPPLATVAVCTRDRPEDLRQCLDGLLQLHENGQELLVIDNCPTSDKTRRLVEGYGKVRYVREDRPGLNVARNRALREAQHDVIAFTDDDATPDPRWLQMLLANFYNPRVLCVTGLTMPLELETEAQETFQRLGGLGRGFKRIEFGGPEHATLDGWEVGAGVNMALRRSVVQQIGTFDETLDVGTPTRGGGDTEFFSRILRAGYRIVYEPEALCWHRHRRRWGELRRQLFGYELAGFAVWTRRLLIDRELGVFNQPWKWLGRELVTLGASLCKRPGCTPVDLVMARFIGAAVGPWAYLYSRHVLRKRKKKYDCC